MVGWILNAEWIEEVLTWAQLTKTVSSVDRYPLSLVQKRNFPESLTNPIPFFSLSKLVVRRSFKALIITFYQTRWKTMIISAVWHLLSPFPCLLPFPISFLACLTSPVSPLQSLVSRLSYLVSLLSNLLSPISRLLPVSAVHLIIYSLSPQKCIA